MRFGSSDGHSQQQNLSITTTSPKSPKLVLPKFQTAYSDIEDRRGRNRRILTFDIQKIDFSITLSTTDHLCIVGSGERKYANVILMRLCVRALISKRQQSSAVKECYISIIDYLTIAKP
jgi:hypothetical protein